MYTHAHMAQTKAHMEVCLYIQSHLSIHPSHLSIHPGPEYSKQHHITALEPDEPE